LRGEHSNVAGYPTRYSQHRVVKRWRSAVGCVYSMTVTSPQQVGIQAGSIAGRAARLKLCGSCNIMNEIFEEFVRVALEEHGVPQQELLHL